jgi:hypothetical protein
MKWRGVAPRVAPSDFSRILGLCFASNSLILFVGGDGLEPPALSV